MRGSSGDPAIPENLPKWANEKSYKDLANLSEITAFKAVLSEFLAPANEKAWSKIMESDTPSEEKLPEALDVKLDIFQKMVIYKILREEKLISLIKNYVLNHLGKIFIESPGFDLKGAFNDSTCTTPIIFVLSPGADPISYLLVLSKEKEMDTRLKMLSLGQGQGGFAR